MREREVSQFPGRGDVNPLQLEFDHSALDIAEPEEHVLHHFAVAHHEAALLSQAILPVRQDSLEHGPIFEASQVCLHRHGFQEWPDIKLRIPHFVVEAESVPVIHGLPQMETSSHYDESITFEMHPCHFTNLMRLQ